MTWLQGALVFKSEPMELLYVRNDKVITYAFPNVLTSEPKKIDIFI